MAMDPVQTSVASAPDRAIAGMIANTTGQTEIRSAMAELALEAGYVVVDGTAAGQVKRPAAAPSATAVGSYGGVVAFTQRGASSDATLYAADEAVNVIRKGQVWMVTETALAKNATPFVRHVAAGAEKLGALRNDADGTDATACNWLRVVEAVSGAGLVLVEVSLPYPVTAG